MYRYFGAQGRAEHTHSLTTTKHRLTRPTEARTAQGDSIDMEDGASRKRARASSPMPPSLKDRRPQGPSQDDAKLVEGLLDKSQRVATLNDLLQLSASHEMNFALSGDYVLKELTDIAIRNCLEWTEETLKDDDKPIFSPQQCWTQPPTQGMTAWIQHCRLQLDPQRRTLPQLDTLQVVLVIIRNLSYVGANLRLLAYSPAVLTLLQGCLYDGTTNRPLALAALQTLVHLAPHLDVSGQKLLSDKLFYYHSTADGGPAVPTSQQQFGLTCTGQHWGFGGVWLAKRLDTREDTVANIEKDFLLSLTADQLVGVWTTFSALTHVLTTSRPTRAVLLLALDLLQELINHARVGVIGSVALHEQNDQELPKLRTILVHMPDQLLQLLADWLYIPRLGPDALDYMDPVHHIVTRVTSLRLLLLSYDERIDTDVRDRALEILVPLLELDSPRMATRLGSRFRGGKLDAIVPILTTKVGRNEAGMLAAQLLREISKSPANRVGLRYVQSRLVELASRDPRVSQLVWNHLYVLPSGEADESSSSHGREDEAQGEA